MPLGIILEYNWHTARGSDFTNDFPDTAVDFWANVHMNRNNSFTASTDTVS